MSTISYTRGCYTVVHFVKICGTKYVLHDSPIDANTGFSGFTQTRCLDASTLKIEARARPGEVWPELGTFDLQIFDKDETLCAYLAPETTRTRITSTVSAADTTVNVESTSGFLSASGVFYLADEAIAYSTTSASAFQGCTRAYYDSVAREHTFDNGTIPAVAPECCLGPVDYRGRRVEIFEGEVRGGQLSDLSQVFVGIVCGPCTFEPGLIRVPVKHVLTDFLGKSAIGTTNGTRIKGLLIRNEPWARQGRIGITYTFSAEEYLDEGTIPIDVTGRMNYDIVSEGAEQWYSSLDDLYYAIDVVLTGSDHISRQAMPDGTVGWNIRGDFSDWGVPGVYTIIGDPTFGCDGGLSFILGIPNIEPTATAGQTIAGDKPPFATWIPTQNGTTVDIAGLTRSIHVDDGTIFQAGDICFVGSDQSHPMAVYSADSDQLTFQPTDFTRAVRAALEDDGGETAIAVPGAGAGYGSLLGAERPRLSRALKVHRSPVYEFLRGFWSQTIYSEIRSADYVSKIPDEWLPSTATRDEDIDWDTLRNLVDEGEAAATAITTFMRESFVVADITLGPLMACGVYAAPKRDGTITWEQCGVPSQLTTATALSGAYLDGGVLEIETAETDDRLINVVEFEPTFLGTKNGNRNIYVVNEESVSRYRRVLAADASNPLAIISKEPAKIPLHIASQVLRQDQEERVAEQIKNTTMAMLGVPRSTVVVKTTPASRTIEIGDYVSLTHPAVRDPTTGRFGTAATIGLVLGFSRDEKMDELTLMLFPSTLGAITPCARGVTWSASRLHCSTVTAYKAVLDTSDLEFFEVGQPVGGFSYDLSTATNTFTGIITSIDVSSIGISLDGGSGAPTPPCLVYWRNWTLYSSSDEAGEGWVWIGDDSDGQVNDDRAAWRWA